MEKDIFYSFAQKKLSFLRACFNIPEVVEELLVESPAAACCLPMIPLLKALSEATLVWTTVRKWSLGFRRGLMRREETWAGAWSPGGSRSGRLRRRMEIFSTLSFCLTAIWKFGWNIEKSFG